LSIGLRRALDVLSRRHELDLACYEPAALHGRIQRRIERVAESDAAYADLLLSDPDEIDSLYRDVLVGTTAFFADDEAYADLGRALRLLVKHAGSELRIWIAGCATGEELYSVAILLDEARRHLAWRGRIRLFATDVHQEVVKQASEGIFPKEALLRVSASRRRRYFLEDGSHVRAASGLREMVVCAVHDLLTDAPFAELDLICCRNVLPYFELAAQARVLERFRFALRPRGLLFLGARERPLRGRHPRFEPVRAGSSLYAKAEEHPYSAAERGRRRDCGEARRSSRARDSSLQDGPVAALDSVPPVASFGPELYEALLERYAPPAFVLDASERLIACVGGAERWLAYDPGALPAPLLGLLDGPLRDAAAEVLERYRRQGSGAYVASGEDGITVSPLGPEGVAQRPILVEIGDGLGRDRGAAHGLDRDDPAGRDRRTRAPIRRDPD
jgi:two-component system CheB/CheR fusion protein